MNDAGLPRRRQAEHCGAGDPCGSRRRWFSATAGVLLGALLATGWGGSGALLALTGAERIASERLALPNRRFAIVLLRSGSGDRNGYLLLDRTRQKLLVLDPPGSPAALEVLIKIERLPVGGVLVSHRSPATLADATALARQQGCPLFVPPAPPPPATGPTPRSGEPSPPVRSHPDDPVPWLLQPGRSWSYDGWTLRVLTLPGTRIPGIGLHFAGRWQEPPPPLAAPTASDPLTAPPPPGPAFLADERGPELGHSDCDLLFPGPALTTRQLGDAPDIAAEARLRRAVVREVLPLPDTTLVLPWRGSPLALVHLRRWLLPLLGPEVHGPR